MAITKVAIRSKHLGLYVSLGGTGIKHYREPPYQGTVTALGHVKSWEIFNLHYNNDGTVSFEASVFPNVYLSADGNGVKTGVSNMGGSVAAQYTAQAWEKFKLRRIDNNTALISIESAAFPGRYLALDGIKKDCKVQGVIQEWEQFEIIVMP